jgi:hypothetical protein
MSAFGAFFKNFFHNVAADPVSTTKGLVQLASAAGVGYGMAMGVIPLNIGVPMCASFATSGVHALGTNTATGTTDATAPKVEAIIQTAAAATPVALGLVDQVAAMKKEADNGQSKIDQYQAIAAAIGPILGALTQPAPATAEAIPAQAPIATP